MEAFKNKIKEYLNSRAQTDELFAATYAKEHKNIDECINYILSEVRELARASDNEIACTNEEIYSLAVHYYDEDDIKPGKANHGGMRIVIGKEQLTDEDLVEAKQKAIAQYQAELLADMKQKAKPVKKKAEEVTQPSLFDV